MLNFQSATIEGLLDIVAEHKNINPFTADDQQLFNFYDELNSIVYGMYKSGVLDKKGYDLREAIPGAFNDFTSYIQEMDRLHEEFRNQRNVSAQAKAADGGVDALMNLANEVPYGTKGSVRPDYYKSGFSVDIKNYNVESASGRSNLVRNIEAQHNQRIENLPNGTKQAVLIDVRVQNVSISALLVLYNDIIQRTNNGVEVLFKMN